MKKLYILLLLFGLSALTYGQIYLNEDFSDNEMPPDGWSIDAFESRWSVEQTSNAGGAIPEARFSLWPQVGTSHLISPTIDLTGEDSVTITFKHQVWDYAGSGYTLGIATRSSGGDWNDVWTINPTGSIPAEQLSISIDNNDVGAVDFQISFYVDGDFYDINYWYLDDIWLHFPANLDAGMKTISTPTYLTDPSPIEGIIKNFGTTEINDIEISWQLNDGEITTTSFDSLNLAFTDEFNFICAGLIDIHAGTYTLAVWIETVNGVIDDDLANNLQEKTINMASHSVQHRPCLEEFTSSTCGPCAGFNASFDPWWADHEDEITLVKYQMNWPGSGDPYYTAEGGVRRDLYNVIGVPTTFLDAIIANSSMSTIQNLFNASIDKPGLVKVLGSHTLTGTVLDMNATVLPFAAITNAVVHVVVFEYTTYNNASTNGETEFHHVMMKMVPDAYGTSVDLQDRVPVNISESVDLAGTNVEEWDDLGVAIFVQDMENAKYIFQSGYSLENASYASDALLTWLIVDGVLVPGFSPDVFDYTITLQAGTVEVPEVTAVTEDPNALAIIVPANELPGASTVDVFAEDLITYNTYTVNFDISTGEENVTAKTVNIFPNPTAGQLNISGADNARVTVYNSTGKVVALFDAISSDKINLEQLENGIYFLSIVIDNKTTLNKKISIIK